MKVEWAIDPASSDEGRQRRLATGTFVTKRHLRALHFLAREIGFKTVPNPVEVIRFRHGGGATYFRKGERTRGVVAKRDTIEIGIDRKPRGYSPFIGEIRWDVVHEVAHHLHHERNPSIEGNRVWGIDGCFTFPLDNWYLRETVAEYASFLFYAHRGEEFPFEYFKQFHGRVDPVLELYLADKKLLRELVECDELQIPIHFMEVGRKMREADLRRFSNT